jgi:hypothetical protein
MELVAALVFGLMVGMVGFSFTYAEPERTPDLWPSKEQRQMLRQCAQGCRNGMLYYDSSYGRCACHKKPEKKG